MKPLHDRATVRAVYGNIDGGVLRVIYPKDQRFEVEGCRVWITHIGGHPKRYAPGISASFQERPVDLFICGHSHIVKAGYDKRFNHLHLNPGAAGKHGWHKQRTAMRFGVKQGKVVDLDLIELP
jgi:predicted phosphodiesterase